jgi:hypothetical protein
MRSADTALVDGSSDEHQEGFEATAKDRDRRQ